MVKDVPNLLNYSTHQPKEDYVFNKSTSKTNGKYRLNIEPNMR